MADEKNTNLEQLTQIAIYYQRSRHYRTIHVDGAQVGLTPRGHIQFTLFSDQKPMPEYVLHRISPAGTLGEPIEEVTKDGVIREVEVNVVMDAQTTVQFVNVLQGMLKQLEGLQKAQPQMTAAGDTETRGE